MNKKAIESMDLIFWMVILLVIAGSITGFMYLTNSNLDRDLDVSSVKHFTLKQILVNECFSSNNLFDAKRINELNIRSCINSNNAGFLITLDDLDGKNEAKLAFNQPMTNRIAFCSRDDKVTCSSFRQLVLNGNQVNLLKLEVITQNE